MHKIHQFTNF